MKEINKRLVEKLPENKPKVNKEQIKKESSLKRKENLEIYTKNLKQNVIAKAKK